MRTATLYSEELTAISSPGSVMLKMSVCSVVGHQYMWDIAGVASKEQTQYRTYIDLLKSGRYTETAHILQSVSITTESFIFDP
jgi:hypothetical protein